jgi:hypothetical protein
VDANTTPPGFAALAPRDEEPKPVEAEPVSEPVDPEPVPQVVALVISDHGVGPTRWRLHQRRLLHPVRQPQRSAVLSALPAPAVTT